MMPQLTSSFSYQLGTWISTVSLCGTRRKAFLTSRNAKHHLKQRCSVNIKRLPVPWLVGAKVELSPRSPPRNSLATKRHRRIHLPSRQRQSKASLVVRKDPFSKTSLVGCTMTFMSNSRSISATPAACSTNCISSSLSSGGLPSSRNSSSM